METTPQRTTPRTESQILSPTRSINLIVSSQPEKAFCNQISEQLLICFQGSTTLVVFSASKQVSQNTNHHLAKRSQSLERLLVNSCYQLTLDHQLYFERGELFAELRGIHQQNTAPLSTSLVRLCTSQQLRIKGVVVLGGFDDNAIMAAIKDKATAVWIETQEPKASFSVHAHQVVPRNEIISSISAFQPQVKTPLQAIPIAAPKKTLEFGDSSYSQLVSWLKSETNIDFSCYRERWLLDSVETRCQNLQFETFSDYLALCKTSKNESKYFLSCLKKVQRSKSATRLLFNKMKEAIRTNIDHCADTVEATRVWIPGCGSSKEILLFITAWKTVCAETGIQKQCQVFASDIIQDSVHNKRALVNHRDIEELSHFSQISEWTYPEENRFFFPELTNNVIRVHHNLTQHPAFPNLNIIICRNTLCLFKDSIRENILAAFHNSLTTHGILLLDEQEVTSKELLLSRFTNTSRGFYIKKNDAKKTKSMAYQKMILPERPAYNFAPPIDYILRHHKRVNRYAKHAKIIDQVIDQHMTPGFLLNKEYEIEHLIGDISQLFPLIDHSSVSKDIRDRLDTDLRDFLLPKIQRLFEFNSNSTTSFTATNSKTNDTVQLVIKLCYYQVQEQSDAPPTPYCLILFEPAEAETEAPPSQAFEESATKARDALQQSQEQESPLQKRYSELLQSFEHLSSIYDKLSQKYEKAIEEHQKPS